MRRHIDPEMMDHVQERFERLRDYTPSEEFDATTALMQAKREIEPLYGPVPTSGISTTTGGEPGGTDGE